MPGQGVGRQQGTLSRGQKGGVLAALPDSGTWGGVMPAWGDRGRPVGRSGTAEAGAGPGLGSEEEKHRGHGQSASVREQLWVRCPLVLQLPSVG